MEVVLNLKNYFRDENFYANYKRFYSLEQTSLFKH